MTQRPIRWLWLLVPLGIVLAFERLILTALTLWHRTVGLAPEVFFYLPFLSVLPPLALFLISWLRRRRGASPRLILTTRGSLASDVILGGVSGMLCVIAFVASLGLLKSLGIEGPDYSSLSWTHHVFFSTLGALVPGIAEEVYFRGFLMERFRDLRPAVLLVSTSASFASWHTLTPSYLLHTFLIGLILGSVVHRARRLLPAMIGHTLANASAGVLILEGWVG